MVPRIVVGAVNGVEIVTVGALRITREVLVRTVAGAADIGTVALGATTAGVREVVSAATRVIGDIAGAARGGLRETLTEERSALTRRSRRRARGPRAATRPGRSSLAA